MVPEFQFFNSHYGFIDSPDLINLNTDEVKYDSDWSSLPDSGKLLQYTKFKSTEAPFRRVLEDDIVCLEHNGEVKEIIVENPIYMSLRQFELLTNATAIQIIKNANESSSEEE